MRLSPIILLCICTPAVLALENIPVGKIFDEDLKTVVTKYTYEMITDETSIDINQDGKDEIAIGITCGNAGCDYFIFGDTNDGRHKYLGNLFFHPMAISIDPKSNVIKTYIRLNAGSGCYIYYSYGDEGFKERQKECNY